MATPVRPSRTAVTWAPGNYASGPYTGSPARAIPGSPVLIPGTGAAAETVNYALGTASDDVTELQTWAKATYDSRPEVACANWKLPAAVNGARASSCMTYNAKAGLWFVSNSSATPAGQIYASADGGETWTSPVAGSTGLIGALATSPVTGNSFSVDTAGFRCTYTASTATWAVTTSSVGAYGAETDIAYLSGGRAVWATLSGSARSFVYSDNDGNSGSSGTGSYAGTGAMKIASSGAVLVGFCSAPTTTRQYVTSTDGAAWTARTFPTTAGSATAVTWDPYRSLFFVSLAASVGNGSTVLSSPDGVTWTTVSTQALYNVADIHASPEGATLALGSVAGLTKVLYSLDGCATWLQVETTCPVLTSTGATGITPRGALIKHGAGRWAILNASATVRMSLTYTGFTPTALTF
jgi:hypothetical protein